MSLHINGDSAEFQFSQSDRLWADFANPAFWEERAKADDLSAAKALEEAESYRRTAEVFQRSAIANRERAEMVWDMHQKAPNGRAIVFRKLTTADLI